MPQNIITTRYVLGSGDGRDDAWIGRSRMGRACPNTHYLCMQDRIRCGVQYSTVQYSTVQYSTVQYSSTLALIIKVALESYFVLLVEEERNSTLTYR